MKKILTVFGVLLLLLISLDYAACTVYCRKVGHFFRWNEIHRADAAVVFFGDHDRHYMPGRETLRRLDHALELYREGMIDNLICVGGISLVKKRGVSGSYMMRDYLIRKGVPGSRVMYDSVSYDSFSNWEEARRMLVSNGWKTVTLISSPFHLYRLSGIVDADGLVLSFSPYSRECKVSLTAFMYQRQWIHHEWIAYAALKLLPEQYYRKLLRMIRY